MIQRRRSAEGTPRPREGTRQPLRTSCPKLLTRVWAWRRVGERQLWLWLWLNHRADHAWHFGIFGEWQNRSLQEAAATLPHLSQVLETAPHGEGSTISQAPPVCQAVVLRPVSTFTEEHLGQPKRQAAQLSLQDTRGGQEVMLGIRRYPRLHTPLCLPPSSGFLGPPPRPFWGDSALGFPWCLGAGRMAWKVFSPRARGDPSFLLCWALPYSC